MFLAYHTIQVKPPLNGIRTNVFRLPLVIGLCLGLVDSMVPKKRVKMFEDYGKSSGLAGPSTRLTYL